MLFCVCSVFCIAEKEMADKIAPVSLGQGQGPKASLLITDAMATGKSRLHIVLLLWPWIFL